MFACLLRLRGAGFPVKPDYIPVVVITAFNWY
jgi:hypothetical protein